MSNLALNAIDLVVCFAAFQKTVWAAALQKLRQGSSLVPIANGRGGCQNLSKEGIAVWVACYAVE